MKNKNAIDAMTEELLESLPEAAQSRLERLQTELQGIDEQCAERILAIEAELQARIEQVRDRYRDQKIAVVDDACADLESVKQRLMQAGEMEHALAVTAQMKLLMHSDVDDIVPGGSIVHEDPGSVTDFENIGEVYRFRVTGESYGSVWGSGPYTSDSSLAAAAVHAGRVAFGETKEVRIRMVDMQGMTIRGSSKNGVETSDWGSYDVGFEFL